MYTISDITLRANILTAKVIQTRKNVTDLMVNLLMEEDQDSYNDVVGLDAKLGCIEIEANSIPAMVVGLDENLEPAKNLLQMQDKRIQTMESEYARISETIEGLM